MKELGLEYLERRRYLRHLGTLCKAKSNIPPELALLPTRVNHSYNTRNSDDIATYQSRTDISKFSFLP